VFHNVYNHLIAEGRRGSRSVEDLFGLLIVMYRLERISDQAKNICEETVFAVTGEVKPPKVFHILFVDERNDCGSLMAEAIARRMFPDSGTYESAGWQPAARLREHLVEFMARSGYDLASRAPRKLEATWEDLRRVHVIVSLESGAYKRIPELPFRTVLVEWPMSRQAVGAEEPSEESLEATYKDLVAKICDLMETLRGKVTS
jgi:protein-tyrosine-phosphatase